MARRTIKTLPKLKPIRMGALFRAQGTMFKVIGIKGNSIFAQRFTQKNGTFGRPTIFGRGFVSKNLMAKGQVASAVKKVTRR